MKDDIRRIMQLVKEGKLSPEDAAELIEAFQEAPEEPRAEVNDGENTSAESEPGRSNQGGEDPFSKLVGAVEQMAKDVAQNPNWKDISGQIRQGVSKGMDAIKEAAQEAKRGRGPLGGIFAAQVTRTIELPLQVPEGGQLMIDSSNGDIHVEGGHPIGSVTIEAAFRGYTSEEAEQLADRFTPSLEESDHTVTLRQLEQTGVTADVFVKVAKGVPVTVKVASGNINITETFAPVTTRSSSGDVRIAAASGDVDVSAASGDVRISHSQSKSVNVETKSGDVILDAVQGAATIRTASGDVTLYSHRGQPIHVEAASGSITADLAEPLTGKALLRTVSGDITFHIAEGGDANVSIATLRGEVRSQIPLEDATVEPHKVTGRMGSGNGTLDVSAVNGDIHVAITGAELTEDPPTVETP